MDKKYTYDEVLAASTGYFSGNELSAKVFTDKYALRDKDDNFHELTPDDLHNRMASEFARIDRDKYGLDYDERYAVYRDALDGFKRIVLQGSVMRAVGNAFQTMSASNCVAIGSPNDELGSIVEKGKELAQLFKRGCGNGLDISTLRPEDMPVNNAARKTSGAWSFAGLFSYITRIVGQNNRRGALILTLSVHHPDVCKFATMKNDKTLVTSANISIKLTDEFLKAVENDTSYEQRWPVDSKTPDVSRLVRARDVWNIIIKSATHFAEPGLLMIDTITKNLPANFYDEFKTITTNPCCFAKDNDIFVITKNGLKEIKQITKKDMVWIDSEKKWARASGYFGAGLSKVYRVILSSGNSFEVTGNHKLERLSAKRIGSVIKYTNNELIEVNNLKVGDRISVTTNVPEINWGTRGTYDEGLVLGWLSGDGFLSFLNPQQVYPSIVLEFWQKEYDVAYKLQESLKRMGYDVQMTNRNSNGQNILRLASFVVTRELTYKYHMNVWNFKTGFNDFLFLASKDFIKGYISSYFSADGTVNWTKNKNCGLQLASIDKDRLIQIQNLLYLFGIKSSVTVGKREGKSVFRGAIFNTKTLYRLCISGYVHLKRFYDEIGFVCGHKHEKLNAILETEISRKYSKETYFVKIVSIEDVGEKEVGCISVDNYHKFSANGIISGNSEIPLSAYDSCRLISLNLTGYVNNAFSEKALFDFEKFRNDLKIVAQMGDNLVDLELELVDKIKNKAQTIPFFDKLSELSNADIENACENSDIGKWLAENLIKYRDNPDKGTEKAIWDRLWASGYRGRRIGIGSHGLADTLAQLCIKYDSEDSLKLCDLIYNSMRDAVYGESVNLAKIRGPFPIFDYEKEKNCEFIKRLPKKIIKDMEKHGRRNVSLLTLAPTGSISIISKVGNFNSFNVSSGIEPVFRNEYIRRKKIHADDGVEPDYIDSMGDKWVEYRIYHSNVKNYLEINQNGQLPDYFVSSDKIDWARRIELQGIIQKYIDHSISSTLNFPKGTDEDTVGKVYFEAWKRGLKGITVYVEGSRDGVLITDSQIDSQAGGRPQQITKASSPKRPNELPCEIHNTIIDGEKWTIFVGMLCGDPYEVFLGKADKFEIPLKHTEGKLVKAKKGKYNLLSNKNDILVDNIVETADNDSLAWASRMISMSLRHGIPIEYVTDQLSKDGCIVDFNNVMARLLKKYIKQREKRKENCPQCGSPDITYSEGCKRCNSCGWSPCS